MRLDAIEVLLEAKQERLTLPLPVDLPIQRGSIDACLTTALQADAVHPTLHRTLAVEGGKAAPFTVFTKDVRALWPRGGPVFLVVRYGAAVVASQAVKLVL